LVIPNDPRDPSRVTSRVPIPARDGGLEYIESIVEWIQSIPTDARIKEIDARMRQIEDPLTRRLWGHLVSMIVSKMWEAGE